MTESKTQWPHRALANAPEITALCILIARLWLMLMPSGLWTDETVTAFVAQNPEHASLAIVPPYTQSIYYELPRAMHSIFGFSEIGYRIPSVFAMGVALFFIARIAARVIHPDAAWFAVFTCLALPGVNYFAIDAKPYALGMCCAAGALYFLIRWMDFSRWSDAVLFVIAGALLWRVQEVYWPFYLVFGGYAVFRLAMRDTDIGWFRLSAVAVLLALALVPVGLQAWALFREADVHVFLAPPSLLDFRRLLRRDWNFIAVCGGFAWLAARLMRSSTRWTPRASDLLLVFSWWLVTPVTVFLFSRFSGASLFTPRYLSLSLAGVGLAATMAAALYVPSGCWRVPTIMIAAAALAFSADWKSVWPEHDAAAWRRPAQYVNSNVDRPDTPILCISPFIEAVPPVWRSNYPLPGFLYAQLFAYPLQGMPYLFPVRPGNEARDYANQLSGETLIRYDRFLIYGGIRGVEYWRRWLSQRPEFQRWRSEARDFGDIRVVILQK